ncbi:DUF5133 domain-containing protein [Streptomyces erythrochromogenes]|uniref:DUF5133 domain-containing protein n=1 Tax=Streptomyces erythrochromogenes TaxID=285574 RepID=UPI00380810BE
MTAHDDALSLLVPSPSRIPGLKRTKARVVPLRPRRIIASAVGRLMATTPAPALAAERILSLTAAHAGISAAELAFALEASHRHGTALSPGIEQALLQTVQAVRNSPTVHPSPGSRLAPDSEETEQSIGRFYAARVRLIAEPTDETARQEIENALYALCALMAQASAYDALQAALQYTRAD